MFEEENQDDDDEYLSYDIEYEECVHEGKVLLKCSICKSMFEESDKLVEHFTSAHLNEESKVKLVHEGKKLFECKLCTQNFLTRSDRTSHLSLVHSYNMSRECPICNIYLESKMHVEKHLLTFHYGRELLECTICKETFTKAQYLETHMCQVHKKSKYECLICRECFLKVDQLREHSASVHEGRKFPCSDCKWTFKERKTLRRHIGRAHEKKLCIKSEDSSNNVLESKLGVPKTKDIWNMTFFKNLALKSPRAFRCHKSDWANFCKLSYHDHQNPPTEEIYIDFIKKIKGSWAADKTIYNIYLRLRKIALHVYGQELQKFDNHNEIFYDEYMKPKHKKGSLM